MNHLYYVEMATHITKIGFHEKAILTEAEVNFYQKTGWIFYRKQKIVAKSKSQEVEIRRVSGTPRFHHGKYGVDVECVE